MVFCFWFHTQFTKNIFYLWIKERRKTTIAGGIDDNYLLLLLCRWKGKFNVQIITIIPNIYTNKECTNETHTRALGRFFSSDVFLLLFYSEFSTFLFFPFIFLLWCNLFRLFQFFLSLSLTLFTLMGQLHTAFLPVIRFLFAYC